MAKHFLSILLRLNGHKTLWKDNSQNTRYDFVMATHLTYMYIFVILIVILLISLNIFKICKILSSVVHRKVSDR